MSFGAVVRLARERFGLTQEELALRMGSRQSEISRLENNHVPPSGRTLARIAKAFGCTLSIRFVTKVESAADTRDGCEAVIGVATSNSPQDTHP